jgi:hypothetical protein
MNSRWKSGGLADWTGASQSSTLPSFHFSIPISAPETVRS